MPPKSKSENAIITEFSKNRDELASAIAKERAGVEKNEAEEEAEVDITEHLMSIADGLAKHDSNQETGLTKKQVAEKEKIWGKNQLTPPKTTPLIVIFIGHLTGFFSLLLWVAAVLCFIAYGLTPDESNLYLGIVLSLVTLITGIFSFYQDYQSAAVMAGFGAMLPPKTTVLREGETSFIPSQDLVPGDIVMVKAGDRVPADFRVLDASNFNVNNSSLTGESLPQKRDTENTHESALEATNLAFFGTLVEKGNAVGLVISTGDNSVIGNISKMVAGAADVQTPINQEIHHFIMIVSSVAIFLGVTFLIIGFALPLDPIQNLVFAIGIIVANVPEGLLATVTVSLTLTAKRMAKKKVLVKNLEAVETLGSTTVIASDKTGTLTQNIMTVKHVYYNGGVKLASGTGPSSYDAASPSFQTLKTVANLCNNAKFDASTENMAKEVQGRVCIGDASESALLKFCEKSSNDAKMAGVEAFRVANPKLAEVPFNSTNKYQLSIHMMDNDPNKDRMLVMKGAPERIWSRCETMLIDGKPQPIDQFREQYDKDIQGLMEEGERVLAMCYLPLSAKDFPPDFEYNTEDADTYNFPVDKLIFAGLMSLQDPPRPAVPGAVLSCQTAGIRVIMVTGDHPDTAEAIAKQVNIITGKTRKQYAREQGKAIEEIDERDPNLDAVVITGAMLSNMSPVELDYFLDFKEVVFARTSPAQKLQIVQGLQNKTQITRGVKEPVPVEHVVAVTGDGVNDSPALKAANIGVAMGIVGSDVAKDAADMILLNDNFASIVKGVEEGRLIFDNLKKSIAYTLSSNIPEISPFLIFILIQIPEPLSTVLILCIDLGTDMIPAISLAYETREADIMLKPPRDMRVDRLVASKLINFSYFQIGMVQAAAGFYTYVVVLMNYGFPPEFLPGHASWFQKGALTLARNASDINATVLESFNIDASYPHPVLEYCGNPLLGRDVDVCDYYPLTKCAFPDDPLCWNATPAKSATLGALQHAQAAFFIAIIVVQWADLVICKTRTLSMFTQGMRNGTLNFGLFFTTVLGSILCYVPGLPMALGTAPLAFVHWCPAMPFCILIFCYDEVRKYLIRKNPKGWVFQNTYY